jgi:hypothetical protein
MAIILLQIGQHGNEKRIWAQPGHLLPGGSRKSPGNGLFFADISMVPKNNSSFLL